MSAARRLLWSLVAAVCLVVALSGPTRASDGIVRVVIFHSPTCPHCHTVLEKTLPPLIRRHGSRLHVVPVNTATTAGLELYKATVDRFGILRRGVPLLVVGDEVLIGSDQIPVRLPALIDQHLAEGGASWPTVPGLAAAMEGAEPLTASPASEEPIVVPVLATPVPAEVSPPVMKTSIEAPVRAAAAHVAQPSTVPQIERPAMMAPATRREEVSAPAVATPTPSAAPAPPPLAHRPGSGASDVVDRILVDPYGNALAVGVLVAMIGVAVWSVFRLLDPSALIPRGSMVWLSPVLAIAGIGVAAYLAQVEMRDVEAVCGPVGDCNAVQQSEYARLFGVLPIGIVGVGGFALILVTSLARRLATAPLRSWAALGELAMTSFGLLFSIYLTFLEPFVIGATCLWCVSSAVLMTLLHLRALPPGLGAIAMMRAIRRHPALSASGQSRGEG